jgi:predicted transcriptional regulator
MRGSGDTGDRLEGAAFNELRLLEEIGSTPNVSQRRLAISVGVALGVVNVLVKAMVTKGYVRAMRLGWRSWAYILTPAGATRKLQLTASYVDRFINHYRRVRDLVFTTLEAANIESRSIVAVYGTTELGELMFLALRQFRVERVVFLDDCAKGEFLGVPVKPLRSMDPDDYAVILVAFASGVEMKKDAVVNAGVCPSRVITLLGRMPHEADFVESERTDTC